METCDQRHAQPDHDRAHDQRAENSPDQDPMFVARRHPEVGEDQDEDEDVIDAERVLDQVTGKKIDRPGRRPATARRGALKPRESATQIRLRQIALRRLMRCGCAIAEKIDGQRDQNSKMKSDPKPNVDRHGALGFHG